MIEDNKFRILKCIATPHSEADRHFEIGKIYTSNSKYKKHSGEEYYRINLISKDGFKEEVSKFTYKFEELPDTPATRLLYVRNNEKP